MARNKVQFQKGISLNEFLKQYSGNWTETGATETGTVLYFCAIRLKS